MKRYPLVLIAAVLACVGAALVFGTAFVGALSVEPLPQTAPANVERVEAEQARDTRPLTNDALMLAVESDPFRPDRQRWPDRYRLPGDELPPEPAAPPPPPPAPPFRLIGTAVTPTGGLAVIELEGETRVVDVGESLLGYTLSNVDTNRAIMTSPDRTVQLPLVAMADNAAAGQTRNARPGQGPRQGGGAAGPAGRAQEAAREMIERVRENGGTITPQMLQMLQRLQQEGRDVQVQTDQGRVMIRTRRDTTDTAPRVPFNR